MLFLPKFHDILLEMKQVLRLLTAYFFICLVGSFVGAVLFSFYMQCSTYIAGLGMIPFSFRLLFQGFFYSLPICLILSPLFLVLYEIRHKGTVLTACLFGVLGLLSFLVFLPLSISFISNNVSSLSVASERTTSAGFFRKTPYFVYYYSKIDSDNKTDGLRIKLQNGNSWESLNPEVLNHVEAIDFSKSEGFSDSLASEILDLPIVLDFIFTIFSIPENISHSFADFFEGDTSIIPRLNSMQTLYLYIYLFSFGLALCSVFFLKSFSSWKLIDIFLASLVSTIILLQNSGFFFQFDMFKNFEESVTALLPMKNLLLPIENIAIAVIFMILGLISKVYAIRRSK